MAFGTGFRKNRICDFRFEIGIPGFAGALIDPCCNIA
jgi:hypothetical protein